MTGQGKLVQIPPRKMARHGLAADPGHRYAFELVRGAIKQRIACALSISWRRVPICIRMASMYGFLSFSHTSLELTTTLLPYRPYHPIVHFALDHTMLIMPTVVRYLKYQHPRSA